MHNDDQWKAYPCRNEYIPAMRGHVHALVACTHCAQEPHYDQAPALYNPMFSCNSSAMKQDVCFCLESVDCCMGDCEDLSHYLEATPLRICLQKVERADFLGQCLALRVTLTKQGLKRRLRNASIFSCNSSCAHWVCCKLRLHLLSMMLLVFKLHKTAMQL